MDVLSAMDHFHGVFPKWDALAVGDIISFVAKTIVLNNQGRHLVCPIDCPSMKVVISGELPQVSDTFSFVAVQVVTIQSFVCCRLPDASHALPVAPCLGDDLKLVVELCSGVGAFSSISSLLGCHVVAGVDQNPRWEGLFRSLHQEDSKFLIGDIADHDIVKQLHWLGANHAIVLAGVSCQPYSSAGDGLGFQDIRSQSLPKALLTTWLLQSPICVLECVEGIRKYPEVTELLENFCRKAGFCLREKVLHLDHGWCAKRSRWFAILTSQLIGPIEVPDFPANESFRLIQNVMPRIVQWPQSDMDQLCLSLYELTKFGEYAKGGIESCYLCLSGVLPTVLHSAGGQLYPCRCGCRKALSLARLGARGLFCTLVPLDSGVFHENEHRRHCRYLHPIEAFYLNGGSPKVNWGDDLRLGLAAVGQCVSPLQALWVVGHVVQKVHAFLGIQPFDPHQALQEHIRQIVSEGQTIWPPQVSMQPSIEAHTTGNDGLCEFSILDESSDTHVLFRAPKEAKLAEFVAAQKHLEPCEDVIMSGFDLQTQLISQDPETLVFNRIERPVQQSQIPCPCEEVNTVESQLVAADIEVGEKRAPLLEEGVPEPPLCALDSQGLLSLPAPLLMIVGGLQGLKRQMVTKEQRMTILSHQGDLCADDELSFHLGAIAKQAPDEQKIVVWDPLVVSSVVRSCCMRPIEEYAKQLEKGSTVITAVLIEQHWYPLVWRWDHDGLHAFSSGLAFNFSLALQMLTKEVCRCLKLEVRPVKNRPVKFLVDRQCGAMAISFIRQLVMGTAFVNTAQELSTEHHMLRQAFANQLTELVSRPWVWGQGEDWVQKLTSLLQEHGVPLSDTAARAQMIVDKLGTPNVSKAMQGPQPWRELKNLANQVVPMIQLISHSELQEVIRKRASSGHPVGTKAQKSKSKGKGKGKGQQQSLDPTLLRVETGVFICGNQSPLSQIELTKVGPNASGVVLLSLQDAMPYLKGGRPISQGGLMFLVLDAGDSKFPTPIVPEQLRIPVICVRNGEPLLVDVWGFQLGAMQVSKQVSSNRFEVVSVSSCVIKIAVYRDQIGLSWKDFIPHPLQHIFGLVPILRPCDDQECDGSCEAWHPSPSYQLADPLLEVWGKQWMMLNFTQSNPEGAQCFTIHVRLPACVLKQIQSYSGVGGLFLEPKAVDGKQPSSEYHVVWLPRASLEEVQVYKRTVKGVVGLARMGGKLGLRCATSDAEVVHALVKPSSSFLPAGRKLFFLLGPVPFGTLKQSVADAVASIGWQARPIQPVPTTRQVHGVLWKLQAVAPPPKNVIIGSHGEMVITSMDQPNIQTKQESSIVGANRTLKLCAQSSQDVGGDPLQTNDPWASYVKPPSQAMPARVIASDPVEDFEKRMVDAVLQRLPKESMEVDSDQGGGDDSRVQMLETQLKSLQENQVQLHHMVVSQGENHGRQIDQLSQQQHRLESAVGEQSSNLQQFQCQFRAQLDQQQGQLDNLFQQQMSRLEELLAKKQRTD